MYLTLSDIGFGSAAANDMSIRVGAGDRAGALATFQSVSALLMALSILAAAIFTSIVFLVPVGRLLHCRIVSTREVRIVLISLCFYALMSLQKSIILAGFRCSGRFASGTAILNCSRLLENVAVIVAVAVHCDPVVAALTLTAVSLVTTAVAAAVMLRTTPWLCFGIQYLDRNTVRALFSPAIAFMAFPTAAAINMSGVLLVMGILLGPLQVAVFATMRTLTRCVILLVETVKGPIWPELSLAYGRHDWALARKLHRHACQAALLLSSGSILFLTLLGHRIYTFWTHGRLPFDSVAFFALVALVGSNSLWNASSVVPMAANRHTKLAALYLIGAVLSVVLSTLGMLKFGMVGAAMSLLLVDPFVGLGVIRQSLRALGESLPDFMTSLVSFREASTSPSPVASAR
jgi:O-antigen/teichoic acid export membrane protein